MQSQIGRHCGHTETVQIYGTNVRGERERRAEWLATQPCSDCVGAQRAEYRQASAVVLTAQAVAAGLPALTGTPKQVAWAESIRMRLLDDLRAASERGPQRDRAGGIMAVYIRAASPVTEARDWIDHRNDPRALLRERMTDRDRAALAAIRDQVKGSLT